MKERKASVQRKTRETSIHVELNLDGPGKTEITTGIPFFDHMLELLGYHWGVDLQIQAQGDLGVDFHHTVEDTGLTLGQAFHQALGLREGINRYGFCLLPMDETLVQVALDISGRPFLVFRSPRWFPLAHVMVGNFPAQLAEEFFRAFVQQASITLHMEILRTRDVHHCLEGLFKGLGRALRQAVALDPRVIGPPSTKGTL
ncbi:imidazoleglycerol-phosphate dehydratase HisB [Candidatus Methylacidithermus pantelleriae]|uniref:Imidazoleglycerol-phosphate dehydratase n=1 Tax=Candidatus Methylacidithermus pantelleriae TaxID=2744239 RepID=A0A8J2FPK8_9BACT|nr:imidazoleglycerol-phosphate dehydratase HisB [Candidatus Methylacidithermus pantelleriae]CAF0703547.1 Imidazoleglycerol-phosphate dehydratase [Candidatus Methylacidithermus pantelleriae]